MEVNGQEAYFKYPYIVPIVVIIFLLFFLIVRMVNAKFRKGVLVANTKYVKRTSYYKYLQTKYYVISMLVTFALFGAAIACGYLAQRYVTTEEEENKVSNRDIFLCMDISGSMFTVNKEVIKNLEEAIGKLQGERFGVAMFNSTTANLSPLTTDYKYVTSILDTLRDILENRKYNNRNSYMYKFIYAGTNELPGASFIGDGLASCSTYFADEDVDRTRVLIFTTDNFSGGGMIQLKEAAKYAKEKHIVVYSIGPESTRGTTQERELKEISYLTGGKYYNVSSNPVNDVVKEILKLEESEINVGKSVQETDHPKKFVYLLVIAICVLFLLERIVKL